MTRSNNSSSLTEVVASIPMAMPLVSLILGILGGYWGAGWISAAILFLLAIFCIVAIVWFSRKSVILKLRLRRWYNLPVLFGFSGIGLFVWLLFSPPRELPSSQEYPFVTARITDKTTNSNGDVLNIEILYLEDIHGKVRSLNSSVKELLYTDVSALKRGDVIRFRNHPEKMPEGEYARFMFSKGVAWQQHVPSERIELLEYSPSLVDRAADLRDRLVSFIGRTPLDSETRGFLQALLLGDREGLSENIYDNFASAGVAHFLALSGMHLGIVVMILSTILAPFGFLFGRKGKLGILFVGIWAFALLTGMSVSIIRAAFMTSVILLSMLVQRRRQPLNSLCLAGFVILLFDPLALFNVGFQMSFLTCAALLLMIQYRGDSSLKSYESRYDLVHSPWADRHPKLLKLRIFLQQYSGDFLFSIYVAIAAFIAGWLLTAYYFHGISLMFLPANIVAIFIVTLIFFLSAVYLPLFAIGIAPGFLGRFIDMLCRLLNEFCGWISSFSDKTLYIAPDFSLIIAYFLALGLLALWMLTKRNHWLWATVAAGCITLVMALSVSFPPSPERFEIRGSKGEVSVTRVSGKEKTFIRYPRGEVSSLSSPKGNIVIADSDRLPDIMPEGECAVLIFGRGCVQNHENMIEKFNPRAIALASESYYFDISRLEEIARNKKIPLHRIHEKGIEFNY